MGKFVCFTFASACFFVNISVAKSNVCLQKSIHEIKVPISEEKPNIEISYKFKLITQSKIAPTIIFIPGGPGGTSIGLDPDPSLPFDFDQIIYGLPKNYNAIFTDPRTKGCNSNTLVGSEYLSTKNVVSDIYQVITQLNLKSYILYGHSYGSIVASQLAHKIENTPEMRKPIAVLLSGVFSKAVSESERTLWYETAWSKFKNELPAKLQSLFFGYTLTDIGTQSTFLEGVAGERWVTFLSDGLTEGGSYIDGVYTDLLTEKLRGLLEDGTAKQKLKDALMEVGESTLNNDEFFLQIYCKEMTFLDSTCESKNLMPSRLYDMSDYQLKSPIIFANGARDPAVSLENALYGYRSQNLA